MPRNVAASASGLADAGGAITLTIAGPHRNLSTWRLGTVVVTSQAPADGPLPTCAVYRSYVATSTLLGESRAADKVSFDASTDWLAQADSLIVVVAGAEPATRVTVNLFGTEYP